MLLTLTLQVVAVEMEVAAERQVADLDFARCCAQEHQVAVEMEVAVERLAEGFAKC